MIRIDEQKILEFLEPEDIYDQAHLPSRKRSLRMLISDAFYRIFMR